VKAPSQAEERASGGGEARAAHVEARPAPGLPGAPVSANPADSPLPGSLEGTDVDGELPTDAAGALVVGPGVRRFFDYFLSATGEEPEATLRARVLAAMAKRLKPPALGQAEALFDRYLGYRREGPKRLGDGSAVDPERRYQTLRDFRRSWFGAATADALFSDQDVVTQAALERRRIQADKSLSDDERRRRIARVDEALPADVRKARAESFAPLEAFERERTLREQGASEQEVRKVRVDAFGEEGARRLEDLDKERAAWGERYGKYQAERQAIEADRSLDAAARERAVEALRERSFAPNERVRARALDSIGTP
jgi:lipase chaperone LimK